MSTGMKKIYKSMQGKEVDMNKLANQHEMTMPVGNARATSAGDQLTPGGQIVRNQSNTQRSVADRVKVPIQNSPRRAEPVAEPVKTGKTASKSN